MIIAAIRRLLPVAVRSPKDPKGYNYCYEVATDGSWYRLYAKLENNQDRGIAKSGCSAGCTCDGDNTYNYKVTSSNAP